MSSSARLHWFVRAARHAFVSAALLLAGCRTAALKGAFADDLYRSPHGNYSFAVPELRPGRTLVDEAGDAHGRTGFFSAGSEIGDLVSIEYFEIPAAKREQFQGSAVADALSAFYRDGYVPMKAKAFAGLRSIHDEAVQDAGRTAHFGVLYIPHGSTMADGKRPSGALDTVRAFLAFVEGDVVYTLGCTRSRDALHGDAELTESEIADYRTLLADLRSRMRFGG